jgi:hypothetical protein
VLRGRIAKALARDAELRHGAVLRFCGAHIAFFALCTEIQFLVAGRFLH